MGYDVTLTQATRDGGKDILVSIKTECGEFLCLVDAKKYREDRDRRFDGENALRYARRLSGEQRHARDHLHLFQRRARDAAKHQYQLSLRDYTDVAGWIQRYRTKRVH